MKITRIAVALVLILIVLSTQVFAENKFINVSWWEQPTPGDGRWTELEDGSLQAVTVNESRVTTIAYVPEGFDATKPLEMPKDFICEVDMQVPDVDTEGWAGLYFRAVAPQVGVGGYLFHINTEGLAILDGDSNIAVIEERIPVDGLEADQFAHVKIEFAGKKFGIWINGNEVLTKENAYDKGGYLGLSTVNYKGIFRNYKLVIDEKVFENFTVPGTEYTGETGGTLAETARENKIDNNKADEADEQKNENTAIEDEKQADDKVYENAESAKASDNKGPSVIVIVSVIAAIAIIAGVAGFISIKKNKK